MLIAMVFPPIQRQVSTCTCFFVWKSSGGGPNNSFDASSELLGPLAALFHVSMCTRTFVQRNSGRGPNNSFDTSSELLGPPPELFYVSIYMRSFVQKNSGGGPNNSFDASSELLGPPPELSHATLRGHNHQQPSFHPLLVFSCLCAFFFLSVVLHLFFFPFHHG
jgi:hypothetical protein